MNYGIGVFTGNGVAITEFKNATDIRSFAIIYLKRKVKEEGNKFNIEGLQSYLDGWVEHQEECNEDEEGKVTYSQIIDLAADNLAYSNVHLQKLVGNCWTPLTSEETQEFYGAIVDKLETVPEREAEKV